MSIQRVLPGFLFDCVQIGRRLRLIDFLSTTTVVFVSLFVAVLQRAVIEAYRRGTSCHNLDCLFFSKIGCILERLVDILRLEVGVCLQN